MHNSHVPDPCPTARKLLNRWSGGFSKDQTKLPALEQAEYEDMLRRLEDHAIHGALMHVHNEA